jgi:hypothetical protein
MKDTWYTLAVDKLGTHKMRLREEMTREEAVKLGIKYCEENGLEYMGTYTAYVIDYAEVELRNEIY